MRHSPGAGCQHDDMSKLKRSILQRHSAAAGDTAELDQPQLVGRQVELLVKLDRINRTVDAGLSPDALVIAARAREGLIDDLNALQGEIHPGWITDRADIAWLNERD